MEETDHNTFQAGSTVEVPDILQRHPGVAIVLINVDMPGLINGLEMQARQPE